MTLEGAERSVGSEDVEAAIRVIDMEEVFVARIACEGHILASSEKILVLRLSISLSHIREIGRKDKTTYWHSFNNEIYFTEIFNPCASCESFSDLC